MANFTVSTTPEQDAARVALRAKMNAERDVPLTPVEFRDYLVAQWLDGLVAQGNQNSEVSLREAWQQANAAKRAQVKTVLGIS